MTIYDLPAIHSSSDNRANIDRMKGTYFIFYVYCRIMRANSALKNEEEEFERNNKLLKCSNNYQILLEMFYTLRQKGA